MGSILSFPPREVWPGLCVIAAFAIGLYVVIASIETSEPTTPFCWGEARRHKKKETDERGVVGHAIGFAMTCLLIAFMHDLNGP